MHNSSGLLTIRAVKKSIPWQRQLYSLDIHYESDDVICLRNHAYTWILVPNIGCKQTMASNTGGPLTFFLVFTLSFFWFPQGNTKRRNFVQIKPRYFEAANSRAMGTSSGQLEIRAYVWVISQNMFCLTHVIMQTHPNNTPYHCHVRPTV